MVFKSNNANPYDKERNRKNGIFARCFKAFRNFFPSFNAVEKYVSHHTRMFQSK